MATTKPMKIRALQWLTLFALLTGGCSTTSTVHDRSDYALYMEFSGSYEATLEQARRFVEGGITEAELEEKKTTIAGTYKVGLATTGGLATALLANAERHFGVAYLDDFPALVEQLSLGEVNDAIRRHLDPEALHVTVAGTLPEDVAPGL